MLPDAVRCLSGRQGLAKLIKPHVHDTHCVRLLETHGRLTCFRASNTYTPASVCYARWSLSQTIDVHVAWQPEAVLVHLKERRRLLAVVCTNSQTHVGAYAV